MKLIKVEVILFMQSVFSGVCCCLNHNVYMFTVLSNRFYNILAS